MADKKQEEPSAQEVAKLFDAQFKVTLKFDKSKLAKIKSPLRTRQKGEK